MHKLLLILLLLSPLAADDCVAQTGALNIVCVECRNPHQYPDDFVNFAFNQLYGPDAWMSYEQADDFFITNLANQRVYVDADYLFLGVGFEGLRLPIWPTNILKFTLALPNGTLYTALRSIFQTSLPVPSFCDSDRGDIGPGRWSDGGGDGGDGDYDTDGYELEAPDYDDHVGFTEIEISD